MSGNLSFPLIMSPSQCHNTWREIQLLSLPPFRWVLKAFTNLGKQTKSPLWLSELPSLLPFAYGEKIYPSIKGDF